VTMMGSNALIRREALASIGGYRPGLAEDLATSIALHAAGWRSAYVAAPLAPGLAPQDVASWFTQQMKWARGVFEVLLTDYPRLWPRLSGAQRLCYCVRMTNYWIGPLTTAYLAATIIALLTPDAAFAEAFQQYLIYVTPLALAFLLIRMVAMAIWRHPSVVPRPPWRAVALLYFTWPIYTLAWLMAVLRLPLRFRPTPKNEEVSIPWVWLLPQMAGVVLLTAGIASIVGDGGVAGALTRYPILAGFAAAQCLLPLIVLVQRLNPHRLKGIRAARHNRHTARSGQKPVRRLSKRCSPRQPRARSLR
jgi:cellulose synthase/poly-beta-1,6-N-acetylglucosamine synthase-like glycosyltransferase